jgi:transposase
MPQPVLGIDIAKDTFDACLLAAGKSWTGQYENSARGFTQMSRWVQQHAAEPVHACMEATGQYGEALADYLYQAGHAVSVVNPARIKAYAQAKLRRNKTDKADAQLIAEYALREQPALWSPPPAAFKELQALVRRLEDVQAMSQQENNRLKSGTSLPRVMADLEAHLQFLKGQLDQLKQAIQAHIAANPTLQQQAALLTSIPGIGKLTAAKLLGEIRAVTEFEDARQLAAYAGLTPRNFSSGTSVRKKACLSKMGNANVRKALYMPALSAKKHNPIVQAFCQRLLKAGLRPKQVIGAAMRKLLHLVYGILKSGQPFDPHFLEKDGLTT